MGLFKFLSLYDSPYHGLNLCIGVLAEMLLESGQASAALREFEMALKENPNRYRGLYGGATAAKAAGERQKAEMYLAKLVVLSKNADTVRPELARAKAAVAQR
jgi:uncharacterized protein HemY